MFSAKTILQYAISFFVKELASLCSPLFTSIAYSIFDTTAGISFVPILAKNSCPLFNLLSSIHKIVASICFSVLISESLNKTHPLDTSTSLFNVIVTGWPLYASLLSLSPMLILFTYAFSLLGSVVISSPIAILPASTCPWNPLNSWFGRHTLCTGI